jgi:flagellin
MQEVQDMLNRMVTLATQSANGTYDNKTDRDNLQKEVVALKSEINRIADSANFNGIKLLDGSMEAGGSAAGTSVDLSSALTNVKVRTDTTAATSGIFSVSLDGYSGTATATIAANATIATIGVGGATVHILEKTGYSTGEAIEASDLTITDTSVVIDNITYTLSFTNKTITFTADTLPATTGDLITNAHRAVTIASVTNFSADTGAKINDQIQSIQEARVKQSGEEASADLTLSKDMLTDGASIKIGNQTFTISYKDNYDPTTKGTTIGVKELLDSDGKMTDTGVEKVAARIANAEANNYFTIGAAGKVLSLQSKTDTSNLGGNGKNALDLSTEDLIRAQVSVTGKSTGGQALQLQIGDTSDSYNQLAVSIKNIHTSSLGIDGVDISTQSGAQSAIDAIKNAINQVSSTRGDLGAVQNRLEHTANNLSVMTENIQDAESTIRDTDIAEEMMAYTKNNILVQSAQAMLAQANTVPQGVLQLLQ